VAFTSTGTPAPIAGELQRSRYAAVVAPPANIGSPSTAPFAPTGGTTAWNRLWS
jgi:hypothetical protein